MVTAARVAWEDRDGVRRALQAPLRGLSGGRLFSPAYASPDDPVADILVAQQGPNYALAKRLQRWRGVIAAAAGHPVSFNVAPSAWTRSVTSNRVLSAAYAGAHRFGIEIFDAETSRVLMAAMLVHDLHQQPDLERHPEALFSDGAVHGGLWRSAVRARARCSASPRSPDLCGAPSRFDRGAMVSAPRRRQAVGIDTGALCARVLPPEYVRPRRPHLVHRKLLIGALAASATFALSVGAAQAATTADGTASLEATAAPCEGRHDQWPKNVTLGFDLSVNRPGTSVGKIVLELPKGLKFSGKGLKKCTAYNLQLNGPSVCPAGSKAGTVGTAAARIEPGNTALNFNVYPFVGGDNKLLFYLVQTAPPGTRFHGIQSVLTGKITNKGRKLSITIPQELRQPLGGLNATLTRSARPSRARSPSTTSSPPPAATAASGASRPR